MYERREGNMGERREGNIGERRVGKRRNGRRCFSDDDDDIETY